MVYRTTIQMSFKKNKYLVVRKAVPEVIANVAYHYLLLKREVFNRCNKKGIKLNHFGTNGDPMITNSYCHYSDILMETLLAELIPTVKTKTKIDIIPTYSYCRLYVKGDELLKHKDRPSCAISTTLFLGGDSWPIYLEPNIKINLKIGDMLIYDGCELEHWRQKFTGNECAQVFLHYNDCKNKDFQFDTRPMLGLPKEFKNA